jgi:hypothetical protein
MAKREIVEGLRAAVGKGEPLRRAMMSFFNAGYDKGEIEEAAIEMKKPQPIFLPTVQPGMPGQPIQPKPSPQVQQQILPPIQQPVLPPPQFRLLPQFPIQTVQTISGYGQKPRFESLVITITLVYLLLFLIGVLAAVFFFKEEISRFIGGGFWSFLY